MYNSEKIVIQLYMYNSKNMELYIPIHSYTFHLFGRFWGKCFWKPIVFLSFCLTKKCGPMGRDCRNQTVHTSYNLGFKIWQVQHNGPQWFKSKGMHVPQNHTFWARQADWKVSTSLTSSDVAKSWPGFTATAAAHWAAFKQIIGSALNFLKGGLAASSNCSLVRFVEPHTSEFK